MTNNFASIHVRPKVKRPCYLKTHCSYLPSCSWLSCKSSANEFESELTAVTGGFGCGAVRGDDRIAVVISCVVWKDAGESKQNQHRQEAKVRALAYTRGVDTRSPVSPGSCCRSSSRQTSSPHSSHPSPPRGGRPRWAPQGPSSQSPVRSGPSRPNRLQTHRVTVMQAKRAALFSLPLPYSCCPW